MQRNTRSQKPGLEAGIEVSARKKKVIKTSEIIEELTSRAESWVNVESSRGTLIEEVEIEPRHEEDVGPSEPSDEKNIETEVEREEAPKEVEKKVEVEPPTTMNLNGKGGGPHPPPPIPPIDLLVRPRGVPILGPKIWWQRIC